MSIIKKRWKETIAVLVLVAFFIIDAGYTYTHVWKTPQTSVAIDTSWAMPGESIDLKDGMVVTQQVNLGLEGISRGSIHFKEIDVDRDDVVYISLWDNTDSVELFSGQYAGSEIETEVSYSLEEERREVAGHNCVLEIKTEGVGENNTLTLATVYGDTYPGGICLVDGEPLEEDLSFSIGTAELDTSLVKTFFLTMFGILLALILYVFYRIQRGQYDLARDVFLPVSLIVGVFYMFIMPPFTIPDEGSHFVTAYSLSTKMMGDYDDNNPVLSRREDSLNEYGDSASIYTYQYVLSDVFKYSGDRENTGSLAVGGFVMDEPILMKAPAAVGITLARLLGLSFTGMIYMGRFFNLLFCSLCIAIAIRLMPFRKEMMFVMGMLPISMQQRSSYSYDGPVFALLFLLIAYVLKLIYQEKKLGIKDYIVLTLATIFIIPVKAVYFVVSLMILLVPGENFKNRKWECGTKILFPLVSVIYTVGINIARVLWVSGGAQADAGYGIPLSKALSDIPHVFYLFWGSMHSKLGFYIDSTLGTWLGKGEYVFTSEFTLAIFLMIGLSLITNDGRRIPDKMRVIYILIFLMSVGMSFASMLLGWTSWDSEFIDGVQGRYIVPVLPLMLMCVPTVGIKEKTQKILMRVVVFGISFINALMLIRMYQMTIVG